MGFLSPVVNYLRALLLESVYLRLGLSFLSCPFAFSLTDIPATMFPETANWLTSAEEYVLVFNLAESQSDSIICRIIRVGINAVI